MANQTTVKVQKSEEQFELEKQQLLSPIKRKVKSLSGRQRNIKLPQYIQFELDETCKALLLYMKNQPTTNSEGFADNLNYTCDKNMQTDNAAFEGWAIVLKAWLPEKIEKVTIRWDIPSDNKKTEHYRRFCYRVLKFKESYTWFDVHSSNRNEIDTFSKCFISTSLINNYGENVPQKKFKHNGKIGENAVEYDMVHEKDFSKQLCERFNLSELNHQLLVGIKENKENGNFYFAGGKAAIDLWGTKENELSIIELKYENEMVGIITELFFYVSIMKDIITGRIEAPTGKLPYERRLYSSIHNYKTINAILLADCFHPLIENNQVFEVLNQCSCQEIQIKYQKASYHYNPATLSLI